MRSLPASATLGRSKHKYSVHTFTTFWWQRTNGTSDIRAKDNRASVGTRLRWPIVRHKAVLERYAALRCLWHG
eukprot:3118177-Prymnesium_polylepis.1